MNRQQIAALYDSMPSDQQDMPREQFIKRAMDCVNPVKNKKIIDAMVDKLHRKRVGEVQRAQIDAAIKRSE